MSTVEVEYDDDDVNKDVTLRCTQPISRCLVIQYCYCVYPLWTIEASVQHSIVQYGTVRYGRARHGMGRCQ